MRVAVNSHALPIYKKDRIALLLCIFETTIMSHIYCYGGTVTQRVLQWS